MVKMEDYATTVQKAQMLLDGGDPEAAYRTLYPLLTTLEPEADARQWQSVFGVFVGLSEVFGDPELAQKVRATLTNPDNPQALYDLGYALIENRNPEVAVTPLARANRLAPNQPAIISELVTALEDSARHFEAVQVLKGANGILERDFMLRYLLAFNSVMSGDLIQARTRLPQLLQEAKDFNQQFMANRIQRMVGRADRLAGVSPLDEHDLRGWHYVISGGLLLKLSPHGSDVMNGRYAWFQDSPSHQHDMLQRLKIIFDVWDLKATDIFCMPDRESRVLGEAAGRLLGLPTGEWRSQMFDKPGLIIAYDLNNAPDDLYRELVKHRPGQILWSHALNWTQASPYLSDIVGFMHQFNRSPWEGGGLSVDPNTREIQQTSAETAPVNVLVERVLTTPPDASETADLAELRKFAVVLKDTDLTAAFRLDGNRERQWLGSPVGSNRFM
jgi:tetratricopeptide (TPR) repeat protein